MKHRIGVKRIAQQAGVSIATVDRVLNQRAGVKVRPATVKKVLDAVSTLNQANVAQLHGDTPNRALTLALVIQSGAGFNTRLQDSLRRFQQRSQRGPSSNIGVTIQEHFTTDLDPDALAHRLLKIGTTVDGVILACQEAPAIREAVDRLAEQDRPVVCITTDLPGSKRLAYVAMDQYRAGRVAGTLIGRFTCAQPGEVLFIVSGSYRCQQEREIGFRQVLRESFPHLSISDSVQSGDANAIAYRQAQAFLQTGRAPLAVYNVSGGNQGILSALSESPALPRQPVYICHDLTPTTRRSLIEGKIDAVIDYDAEQAIASAVAQLTNFHFPDSLPVSPAPLAIRICMADTV